MMFPLRLKKEIGGIPVCGDVELTHFIHEVAVPCLGYCARFMEIV